MSFLSNRPLPLLARIIHVDFMYWITIRWYDVTQSIITNDSNKP